MFIRGLENGLVTVTLDYQDVKDTSSALYEINKTGDKYMRIFNEFSVVRDIMKYGMIQQQTIDNLYGYNMSREIDEDGTDVMG